MKDQPVDLWVLLNQRSHDLQPTASSWGQQTLLVSHRASRQLCPGVLFLPHSCHLCSQSLACCWDARVSSQGLLTDDPSHIPASAQACPSQLSVTLAAAQDACGPVPVGSRQKRPVWACGTSSYGGNREGPGREVGTPPCSCHMHQMEKKSSPPKSLLDLTWPQSTAQHMDFAASRPPE